MKVKDDQSDVEESDNVTTGAVAPTGDGGRPEATGNELIVPPC